MRLPASQFARDFLWATLLTLVTQVELLLVADRMDHDLLQHLVFLPMTGAVALRRRAPLVATVVCGAALAAQTFLGEAPVVGGFLAMLVVLASLGYHADLRRGLVGLAAVAVGALVYDVTRSEFDAADFVGNAVIVVMAWGLAHLVRRSTDARVAAEIARDRAARDAATAERTRIARDLHDSVAHALTLMTLQAGATRERTSEPLVADVLGTIESGGRAALVDMHRFLRLLGDDPAGEAPGLADLDDLLGRVGAGGLTVDLTTEGDLSTVPASISSTAYRVVQEGLTNAAKHSGATEASVEVVHRDGVVRVAVTNPAASAPDPRSRRGPGEGWRRCGNGSRCSRAGSTRRRTAAVGRCRPRSP